MSELSAEAKANRVRWARTVGWRAWTNGTSYAHAKHEAEMEEILAERDASHQEYVGRMFERVLQERIAETLKAGVAEYREPSHH